VLENVPQYLKYLEEINCSLAFAIDTHVHADHVTGLGTLRDQTQCQTVRSVQSNVECVSVPCNDQDLLKIDTGLELKCLYTPGHTDDSYSFHCPQLNALFTGDTLLYRGTGRTDFQNGDAGLQYDSITQTLFSFDDETLVYAGHDYKGQTISTIFEEKMFNPRLVNRNRAEYIELMANLNLPHPKMMDVAVPMNKKCGVQG
jgi:glyoxylase-like metal-dependent hydrolase (beta-lactamase superfamily II)